VEAHRLSNSTGGVIQLDLVQTDENRFELDLVLIANPDDALLIAPYFLEVTINYNEPLLPFELLTRSVMSGFGAAHLCILGYGAVDGLGPPLELTTLGLFIISVLTTLSIPIWYVFSTQMAIGLVLITSIPIPTYLYLCMDIAYISLRNEKLRILSKLADEVAVVNQHVTEFIALDHKEGINHSEVDRVSSELVGIQTIYNSANAMRTFPLDDRMVSEVVSTVFAPVLSLIVTALAEHFWILVVSWV
jgi:hypothetical protein